MNNVNFLLWLPVLALLLGGITHSLTDDGGASILDHFGISWRLPKFCLTVGILVFGTGSGFVDNLVGGQDVQHAAVTAVAALIASIFGATTQHAIVNKTPPKLPPAASSVLIFVFSAVLALYVAACGALGQAIVKAGLDDTECALKEIDQPDDVIVRDCFDKLSADEQKKALDQVHAQRAYAAKAAAQAHDRGVLEGHRLGCGEK